MRTQLVLLGKLLAEPLEVEHVHVKVVNQSAENINLCDEIILNVSTIYNLLMVAN